jgi:hypothetical protein
MEKLGIVRLIVLLAIAGIVLTATGCVVWNSDVSYGGKGAPLSNATLEQIEYGSTTKAWVLATLGEPTEQATPEEGVEVLKYQYSRTEDCNFVMPFVVVNDTKKDEQTVYFEIRDGVVQRYWTERGKRS